MEATYDDFEGFGPYGRTRDVPMSARWDERRHYEEIRRRFGLDRPGAAFAFTLVSEALGRGRYVSASLHEGHYLGRSSANYRYANVKRFVEQAASEGLADVVKGSPKTRGWQTYMRATVPLVEGIKDLIARDGPPAIVMPDRLVIMRGGDGRQITLTPTRELDRMERKVKKLNEMIVDADLPDCQAGPAVRIFNKTMGRGGRAYVQGGGYQSLQKQRRRELTIRGEPVVEIDFKALHPTLLYAQAGLPIPEDCYAVPGLEAWADFRTLVKRAFLIAINAPSHKSAVGALAYSEPMREYMEGIDAADYDLAARVIASDLIADIKRAHRPIAGRFHSDTGADLMKIDSDIAMAVEMEMHRRGIVTLPVHDSFIVPVSKQQDLMEVMFEVAQSFGIPTPRFEVFGPPSISGDINGLGF